MMSRWLVTTLGSTSPDPSSPGGGANIVTDRSRMPDEGIIL